MNSKLLISITAVVLLFLGGYYFLNLNNDEAKLTDKTENSSQADQSVGVQFVSLSAVGNYTGVGIADRSFAEGEFNHSIEAQLSDPAQGKFYEGWLVEKPQEGGFISTGKLTKIDGQYVLEFSVDQDYLNYNTVVITEETEANGLDGKPEVHVLEGKFE